MAAKTWSLNRSGLMKLVDSFKTKFVGRIIGITCEEEFGGSGKVENCMQLMNTEVAVSCPSN